MKMTLAQELEKRHSRKKLSELLVQTTLELRAERIAYMQLSQSLIDLARESLAEKDSDDVDTITGHSKTPA